VSILDEHGDPIECLDAGPDPSGCEGEIEYRMPLSGTGKSFPRCDRHWSERVLRQEEINQRYGHPNSTLGAPSDFDPYYAGERWSDDY
jgi:hypothetical protein